MPIEVECGNCRKRYRVADVLAGKKARCKSCGTYFTVPAGSSAPAVPAFAPTGGAELDPFEAVAQAALRDAPDDAPAAPTPSAPTSSSSSYARPAPKVTRYNGPPPAEASSSSAPASPMAYYPTRRKGNQGAKYAATGGGVGALGVVYWTLRSIGIIGRAMNHHAASAPPSQPPPAYTSPWPGQNDSPSTSDDANASAPTPNWEGVPKVSSGQVKPPEPPKVRLTADGKPIPPPPVDPDGDEEVLHPTFGEESAPPFHRAAAVAPVAGNAKPSGGDEAANMAPPPPKYVDPATVSVLTMADAPAMAAVDALRAPLKPGPFVFARQAGVWSRYATVGDPKDWKVTGQIKLDDNNRFEQPIISPAGEYLVRATFGFDPTIEIYSFSAGQRVHVVNGKGMTHFVGFANDDQFVVAGGDRSMLAFVSCKTGQKVRDLISPVGTKFEGSEVSISPDGQTLAVPVSSPSPTLLVYSATGGVQQRIPLPSPDRTFRGFRAQASAFSRDGKRVAVMGEMGGDNFLYVCEMVGARVSHWHALPGLHFGLPPFWSGTPAMRWLADTECVLLRDATVIDSVSGRTVGKTAANVEFFHEIAPDQYLITWRDGGKAQLCTLDREVLKGQLATARAAGEIQTALAAPAGNAAVATPTPKAGGTAAASATPPSRVKFAANNIVPKKGDAKPGTAPDASPLQSAQLTESPIAIEAAYGQIKDVQFAAGPRPIAAVWVVPPTGEGVVDDATIQRFDLSTGKGEAPVHLPVTDKLLSINADATLAVVSTQQTDGARRLGARVEVLTIGGREIGKRVASFDPYTDLAGATGGKEVVWAALTGADNDGLVTTNRGNDDAAKVLVRWSLSARRAVWARADVRGTPVLSPGGKYLLVRQGASVLLLDPKNGEAVGSLAPEPLAGAEVTSVGFSPDGAAVYAATNQGVVRWDVKTGQPGVDRLTSEVVADRIEERQGGKYLLCGDRLFDVAQKAFVYSYPVYGGRHLYDGPGGRHWYLARRAGDGAPYLCSAALPTEKELSVASQVAAHPPLIHPGVQVALQVSAGPATDAVQQSLAAKLKARGLDQGEVVATLRVSAQERPNADDVPVTQGMSPFNQRATGEKVRVVDYECFYELVDAGGKVLYGSQTALFRGMHSGMVSLRQGETMQSKVDELMRNQIAGWASRIYVPSYLMAEGKIAPRPRTVLKVEVLGGMQF